MNPKLVKISDIWGKELGMDHEGKNELQTIIYNIVEILFNFFQFIQTYLHCSSTL